MDRSDVAIGWVCLSDTHFGAENSLLSFVDDDGVVDPRRPSPTLSALIDCLRVLIADGVAAGHPPPTLILNGDALEFALAQDNVAAMVFDRFIDLAFGSGDPLFAPTILYLPGNHDHHLWETARERLYAHYVAQTKPDAGLAEPWHATGLYLTPSAHVLEAELLTALVQRRAGSHLHVRIAYPNLGLVSDSSPKQVLLHHGHFTEPLYRLMTEARAVLFPGEPSRDLIWDWEADNFAWIDFFWSTLGRSGHAGQDVGLIYDMLQEESAASRLAGELGRRVGGLAPGVLRPPARWLGTKTAQEVLRLVNGRERERPDVLLSPTGERGLDEFLSGPLANQFRQYSSHADDEGVSFLFGHTHKPFESRRGVAGFAQTWSVYNSGGWVVDTIDTQPLQGASVLLIDANCNVASLRMYNQASTHAGYRVTLSSAEGDAANPLHARLNGSLPLDHPPWSTFSEVVADEVDLRHRVLPTIVQRGLTATN